MPWVLITSTTPRMGSNARGGVVKGIKEVQKGLLARASQISRETNNNDNVIYLKAPTMPGTSTVINALEILSNLTS